MKMLFIAPGDLLKGRVEPLQWIRMCEHFTRFGCTMHLVALYAKRSENIHRRELWNYYGLPPKLFRIHILPSTLDVSKSSLRMQRIWNVVCHTLFAMLQTVRNPKTDVVYARKYISLLPYLYLRRALRCPLFIYELHGMPGNDYGPKFLQKVDGIVVNSNTLKEDLVEKIGLSPNKICVAYLAPHAFSTIEHVPQQDARSKLGLSSSQKIVCYTGKLVEKEVDVIFNAAKLVASDVCFIMVGGNEQALAGFRKRVQEDGVDNVQFVGFVPPGQVALYQQASDILLVNYCERANDLHRYITPGKVFEYMASKRPIVACHFAALDEILHDHENAVLFESGDGASLADAISRVLSDEDLQTKLVEKASHDAKMYTWERRVQQILDFIEGLRSERRP